MNRNTFDPRSYVARRQFLFQAAAATTALSMSALSCRAAEDDDEEAPDPADGSDKETAAYRPDYKQTGARLITDSTPLADGFSMPGEELKHEATVMVFPQEQNWEH